VNKNEALPEFNRRNFLKNTSLAAVMAMMGGVELRAEDSPKPAVSSEMPLTATPIGPRVNFGVIGLGAWGREVLGALAILPAASNAVVTAICDNYPASLRRAGNQDAPNAERFDDYQKLLANKDVQAVVIATPTPTHREIALAALQAGKHVYCEAPLANSIEDAKAIARAARDSVKLLFQPGLQERSHPQRQFLLPFIRAGSLGDYVMARAQSHRNSSWVSASSNPEHEKALNWRLHQDTSTGLMGEIGIHQIDAVSWFLKARPTAVTGFGSILRWKDGRDVPDTVLGVFEFPGGVNFMYDATLCNSFDKEYEMYYGTQSAVMVRDAKAWLFKEPDAELGGWEVYARKDVFYTETGIALVANATKQTAIGTSATSGGASQFTPLYYALKAFTANVGQLDRAVKDFVDSFGDSDLSALADSLKTLKPYAPAATWRDGLDATILAIKANESVVQQGKIPVPGELFDL
jgi:predicted dehydrogenase